MKTVLITGVGRGIGKALAQKFLDEGFLVVGTTQDGKVDYAHENLKICKLDLNNPESITACAEEIKKDKHNIDIHINNAGILIDGDETAVNVDKLRKTLEVNLLGPINFTERLIPSMSNDAHVVNVSSAAGSMTNGEETSHEEGVYPAYRISKAAVNMYTVTLGYRLKERGITVSSVHPGWVRTAMGGKEATMSPEEAAEWIYKLAISKPETGGFWFKCERYPW